MDRLPSGVRAAALLGAQVLLGVAWLRLAAGDAADPRAVPVHTLVAGLLGLAWFWVLREAAGTLLAGLDPRRACRRAELLAAALALAGLVPALAGGTGLRPHLPVLLLAFLAAVLATLARPVPPAVHP